LTNKRQGYIPREEVLAEVRQGLAAHQPGRATLKGALT